LGISCSDHPEILLVSLGGIVSAAAIGTPLLVIGLTRRAPADDPDMPDPREPEPTVSLQLGAISGLKLAF